MSAAFWLISILWTWWIARSIQGRAEIDRGQSVVRYGPRIRALSIVAWLVAMALVAIALVEPSFPLWGRVAIVVCSLFLATVVHVELKHSRVHFDEAAVHFISPWRADRLVPYHDFTSVHYHSINDAYVLQSKTYGKFSLHKYMSGIDSLLDQLADHGVHMDLDDIDAAGFDS